AFQAGRSGHTIRSNNRQPEAILPQRAKTSSGAAPSTRSQEAAWVPRNLIKCVASVRATAGGAARNSGG
ncbi:hypothetical protein E2562_021282, partial [Oryza meyeriana var. granulata]